jgi:hypothetical protein
MLLLVVYDAPVVVLTGGDGDFFHTSEAKASLQDVVMNGLLNPKDR